MPVIVKFIFWSFVIVFVIPVFLCIVGNLFDVDAFIYPLAFEIKIILQLLGYPTF